MTPAPDPLRQLREAADRLEARLLTAPLTAPAPADREAAHLIRAAREAVRALSPDPGAERSPLARQLEQAAAAFRSAVRDPSPATLEHAEQEAGKALRALEFRSRKAARPRTAAPSRRTP